MPAEFRHAIKRITLTCGVMVQDVLPGQLRDNEGMTSVPAWGRPPYFWFVAAYPLDLGPQRLAGEVLPGVGQDRLFAIAAAKQVDLLGRSGIDAIKDGRPEGLKIGAAQHQAGTHTTDADRDDRPWAGAGQDLADGLDVPHHVPSASASAQPGRGKEIWCGRCAVPTTWPSEVTSSPLVLEGTDVNPEYDLHLCHTSAVARLPTDQRMVDANRSDRRSRFARYRGRTEAGGSGGDNHLSKPAYRCRSCYRSRARGGAARCRLRDPCGRQSLASSHSQSGWHPPLDQYLGRSASATTHRLHLDCGLRPQPVSVLPRQARQRAGIGAQQTSGHGGSGYAIPHPGCHGCSGSDARSAGICTPRHVISAMRSPLGRRGDRRPCTGAGTIGLLIWRDPNVS